MRVGEMIIAQLDRWGIEAIFGLSGSSILPLLEALRRQNRIHYWTVRHEESAAFMASAYAKLTGRLGVCVAHAGPGAAHLLNGLYDAHKDRYPVLAITGQVPTNKVGTSYKQASNESLMFAGCTGFSHQIAAPDEALELLVSAMRYALTMNDVAHLAIPSDLLSASLSNPTLYDPAPYLMSSPPSDPDALHAAAKTIAAARHPVILMGRGAVGEAGAILALAEHLEAPIITTLPAKGSLSETHPLVVGPLGEAGTDAAIAAIQTADLVLVLGATWWPTNFLPRGISVVQIDRRPLAIGAGHPITVGVVGCLKDIVPQLQANVPPRPLREKVDYPQLSDPGMHGTFPAHPRDILRLIRQHLPDHTIIAVDTGLVTLWYGRDFPARQETTLISGRWRSMGFALPAALAAKIARPRAPVVALVGDGGFAMTGMEFATAVQHNLAITVIVFNNNLLGEEAIKQQEAHVPVYGMHLSNPDFATFAHAAGGEGFRPKSLSELDDVLGRAIGSRRPTLVDVPTLFVAPPTLTNEPII